MLRVDCLSLLSLQHVSGDFQRHQEPPPGEHTFQAATLRSQYLYEPVWSLLPPSLRKKSRVSAMFFIAMDEEQTSIPWMLAYLCLYWSLIIIIIILAILHYGASRYLDQPPIIKQYFFSNNVFMLPQPATTAVDDAQGSEETLPLPTVPYRLPAPPTCRQRKQGGALLANKFSNSTTTESWKRGTGLGITSDTSATSTSFAKTNHAAIPQQGSRSNNERRNSWPPFAEMPHKSWYDTNGELKLVVQSPYFEHTSPPSYEKWMYGLGGPTPDTVEAREPVEIRFKSRQGAGFWDQKWDVRRYPKSWKHRNVKS